MKKFLFLVVILACSFGKANAQIGFEAGGWIGAAHYFGDLNTNFHLGRPGLAGGLIGRYNFNNRVSIKLTANYLSVSAFDSDSDNTFEQTRNLSFKSDVFDGSLQLEFNFLPYTHGSNDEFFTPYIMGGFSVINFDPRAELNGEWYDLRPLGTEGQFKGEEYYSITGGVNFGFGFKIDLNYEWSINIELSSRYLFTDYLDDVSGLYADKDDLEALRGETAVLLADRSVEVSGLEVPIGEAGRQRGNSNRNDSYAMLGIGLVYYFGDIRCPTYSR
ncbi:MAG: DUF6089 family protein [Bacteroidota bacterium]